jgi:hypothetical protein
MTSSNWPAVATVLAALVAAGAALLGMVIKTRWDSRIAVSNEKAQWRRERRERVYADFLRATNRYVRLLPDRPSITPLRYPGQLENYLFDKLASRELGVPFGTPEEVVWQELATVASAVRTYGSSRVRVASGPCSSC